ncbi:MAG: hypothetical protein ACC656_00255 [Candidatus Heimdallarchaeota archaeon]
MSTLVTEFKITESDKQYYTAILLLDNMINRQFYYSVLGDFKYLDDAFAKLLAADRIKLVDNEYVPNVKGREFLQQFMAKYYDYMKMYDVFCGVDTETGEFAFSQYYEINIGDEPGVEAETWTDYLHDERFLDLRVAVAEFKKLNPVELVFMSFINEDSFDVEKDGWEFDVYSGLYWDKIVDIANGSLTLKLVQEAGHDMEMIIKAGTDVIIALNKIEKEIAQEIVAAKEEFDDEDEEYVAETVEYVEIIEEPYYDDYYFDAYYDPFYVSPVWDPWYDPYYY